MKGCQHRQPLGSSLVHLTSLQHLHLTASLPAEAAGRSAVSMTRSCALGTAWLATWLLAGVAGCAEPAAPRLPRRTQVPFVPNVPGADKARAWLTANHEQRQKRSQSPPAWPASLSLPSCAELSEQPHEGQQRQLTQGRLSQGREEQRQPTRHMILATVSDAWGADASRSGYEQTLLACWLEPAAGPSRAELLCLPLFAVQQRESRLRRRFNSALALPS